jgi:hypothetical protein
MKNTKLDTLAKERAIQSSLKNVDLAMELLKETISKGTKLQDELITGEPNSVKFDKIKAMNISLSIAAREARGQYTTAQECLNGISVEIQEALMGADKMQQFEELKKLRTKNTNAKKQLKGYSINKMEELAYKTIERINKAMEHHYTVRRCVK